jgi:acyl carrier protein
LTVPDVENTVMKSIETLLARRENGNIPVTSDSTLQVDLDLDSLELAEFSVMLEEELGRDPYSEGVVPNTVGEVIAFYQG